MGEAVVLCLDNSQYSRNLDGTFTSRLDKLIRMSYLYYDHKMSVPNNSIGLVTMGGEQPKVLQTLTNESGRLLNILAVVKSEAGCNVELSLQLAYATLRHRTRKELAQRIVLFFCNEIAESDLQVLEDNVRTLSRSGISLDIVSLYRQSEVIGQRIYKIIQASNEDEAGSFFGFDNIREYDEEFRKSGVLLGVRKSKEVADNPEFEFGVDPELDPELAWALKASMEMQ